MTVGEWLGWVVWRTVVALLCIGVLAAAGVLRIGECPCACGGAVDGSAAGSPR